MGKSKFEVESPERVLNQAQEFRQTLNRTLHLPVNHNKSMYVEKVAEWNVKELKYSIDRAKYQNTLFRKLQKIDGEDRRKISQSLLIRDNKINQNIEKNFQEQHKKHKLYSKHVNDVQKRYDEQEKKKFQVQKQEAIKLRKQLKQFYEKQELRKKQANQKQIKVSTCYSNALDRINRIQKKNQQFAQKAEIDLSKSFARNSPDKKQLLKLRSTSFDFRKNQQTYQNSQQIFKQRQGNFIQKFAQNQQISLKAFQHKQDENQKVKKRISQKLKKDMQKWAEQKKKIDSRKAQIPQKCTSKMQKALNSSFRNTFSTFRDSFCKWRNTGQFNRSKIKQKDDIRKDELIEFHQDITLRNKSSMHVDERMLSMRQRANKVAVDFL